MPGEDPIVLDVNGARVELSAGATLTDLLRHLKLEGTRVAVEHNRRVVPRAEHTHLTLAAGDRLEIVTFVGGGC